MFCKTHDHEIVLSKKRGKWRNAHFSQRRHVVEVNQDRNVNNVDNINFENGNIIYHLSL